MIARLALPLAAVAAIAVAAPASAAEPAAAAAKGKDCSYRDKDPDRFTSRDFALGKFEKLRAFSLRCAKAQDLAYRLYGKKSCTPAVASGRSATCSVRRYSCRTRSRRNLPTYTGTCTRGARRIAYRFHV